MHSRSVGMTLGVMPMCICQARWE
ncbi:MAG TPA: hypothetical protein DCX32_03645 [Candidatus Moranbacteria bacterium]|nr:hypothetical protein [Candidatus Moranbacteria bacterium]